MKERLKIKRERHMEEGNNEEKDKGLKPEENLIQGKKETPWTCITE